MMTLHTNEVTALRRGLAAGRGGCQRWSCAEGKPSRQHYHNKVVDISQPVCPTVVQSEVATNKKFDHAQRTTTVSTSSLFHKILAASGNT